MLRCGENCTPILKHDQVIEILKLGIPPDFLGSAKLLACRDTAVLCESLTYERGPPTILNGNAVPGRPWTTVYSPPFDEFEVEHVSIPEKARFQGIQTYLPANPVSTWGSTSSLG